MNRMKTGPCGECGGSEIHLADPEESRRGAVMKKEKGMRMVGYRSLFSTKGAATSQPRAAPWEHASVSNSGLKARDNRRAVWPGLQPSILFHTDTQGVALGWLGRLRLCPARKETAHEIRHRSKCFVASYGNRREGGFHPAYPAHSRVGGWNAINSCPERIQVVGIDGSCSP
jgi:hypothetical protein